MWIIFFQPCKRNYLFGCRALFIQFTIQQFSVKLMSGGKMPTFIWYQGNERGNKMYTLFGLPMQNGKKERVIFNLIVCYGWIFKECQFTLSWRKMATTGYKHGIRHIFLKKDISLFIWKKKHFWSSQFIRIFRSINPFTWYPYMMGVHLK